ncbi:hypothetical protein [Compostibacter hankyongensis]|uniref:DNA polymerase III subunit delta n=1 Tax=Compostibacter hankyongensis TaxID=1007089 RepID=A0ABP8G4Y0_9BACT
MLFSDIVGHTAVTQQLIHTVAQNRLSHALLFLSPEGAGGLPMALAFAQYMVCTEKGTEDACGHCDACKKAARLVHPDIHYSYPAIPRKSGDKPLSTDYIAEWREFVSQYPYGTAYDWLQFINAENKQGNISANECQDIIRKLNLKSFESDYKILILWRPEYLGKDGNRLLKLIEEPPPRTLFILVAEKQEQILNTILSRTQLLRIPAPAPAEIAAALVRRLQLGEARAAGIAAMSGGSYREALQLAQHAESDWMQELRDWLNHLLVPGQAPALLQWIEGMASGKTGREKQKQFLRYFINLLEHALRLQFLSPEQLSLPEAERDFATRLNKLADPLQIAAIIRELDAACYHIERNANAKLLLHALSIRLQHIFSRRPLPV